MSDQLKILLYLKSMISDVIYLNGIIASELIKITENLAALRHGEEFLNKSSCIPEHNELNEEIVEIIKRYNKNPDEIPRKETFENHVLKHLKETK